MGRQYYYLVAGLADLVFDDEKHVVHIEQFLSYLVDELDQNDYVAGTTLLRHNDNRNLLHVLEKSDAFIEPATMERGFLEEAVRHPSDLPAYMETFVEAYKAGVALDTGRSWEDQLTRLFYQTVTEGEGYLAEWFTFERDLRDLLAALNCRKTGRSIESAVIGTDFFAEHLIKSTSADFGLGKDYMWVEQLVLAFDREVPIELEREIDLLRWKMSDELAPFSYFGVEAVYAFMVKLLITERWFRLIPERGAEIFNTLVKRLEDSFVVDENTFS